MKPRSEASHVVVEAEASEGSQSSVIGNAAAPNWTGRWPGWLVLWAGWLIPQIVLLGPAFIGRTVDLPVDLLAVPNVYLPARPEYANVEPQHSNDLFDLLLIGPATGGNFVAKELRAGRPPVWQPANFAGAPIVASYSPFAIPYYIAPYPITLAWIAVFQAVTVGLGMWLLLRRSFHLSYWPAVIGSWCAPLTGFMTVWHGFGLIGPFCWLPWLFLAVGTAVDNPRGYASVGVAVLTALVLLSGHPGVGGLVLLTTGLYVLWLLVDEIRMRRWQGAAWSGLAIGLAWTLGFLIAAPYLVPMREYGYTGVRMDSRSMRVEERPPEGFGALVPIVLPEVYSGTRVDRRRTTRTVIPESSSGAYAGLLAALWLAPLAWCDRRRRSQVVFLSALVIVSLGWTLNVPGIVDLLRSAPLRPLAPLSFNRWVLATSVAILILAAIGLESLRAGLPRFRRRWAFPMAIIVGFCGWCLYRFFSMTQELDDQGFGSCVLLGAALCLAGLAGWATTFHTGPSLKWVRFGLICLLPMELFWFAWNERRQADIALYFPPIPILNKLAALPPGRIWGVHCLPPNLNQTQGLEDVRGYDAVDPRNFMRLITLAFDRQRTIVAPYAWTLDAVPVIQSTNRGLKLHPVADLLNVRYLIFRKPPPDGLPIILHEDDYWITENRHALPRAFVPQSVHVVSDDDAALAQLARLDLDPRQTAFVTDDLRLPDGMQGTVSVHYPTPTRAELEVEMQTTGLVVLSDMWDPGWRAELDGTECPIYRVDVAFRGFQVPTGKHRIVCTYHPRSIHTGFRAAAAGGAILLLWTLWKARASFRNRSAITLK